MEKRSHRRIRDLDILAAFQGLVANEIGCARISMMAREQNTPFNRPNTDARDQLSPDRHIQLAPHGRSIQSIWRGGEGHRRRAGGHFCATTRTASLQLICSWCRRFRSDFSMVCCFCGMTDVGFCGWGRPRIQPQNGSPGSLLRPVDGTRLRAISCATAIDPMVRYSSDVFAPWGSEIDPHPRGRRGRTHMRSG